MAEKKEKATDSEALVRAADVSDIPDTEIKGSMAVLSVSEADMPDADPLHAGPEKLGRPAPFDPNAALRAKRGVGPGLQDSEVINPAVWVDVDSQAARDAAADAAILEAERNLERVKVQAEAVRKGEPGSGEL